jgi:hypothetical protein
MFYDDNFHPTNMENESSCSSSCDGSMNYRKKMLSDLKKSDSGYRKISKRVNGEKITIEYYATNYAPGTHIRCPFTGQRDAHHCVGKRDENLYFSCIISTAMNGNATKSNSRTPDIVFYDNPSQYERHWCVKLPESTKELWYARNLEERMVRKMEESANEKSKFTVIR